MPNVFNIAKDGRTRIFCRDRTYIAWTRVIARNILGRYLKRSECVHHIDDDPGNDSYTNFVICTRSYHDDVLHRHTRSGGRPISLSLSIIQEIKSLKAKGFSQSIIAYKLDISQSYVSRILNKKRRKYSA